MKRQKCIHKHINSLFYKEKTRLGIQNVCSLHLEINYRNDTNATHPLLNATHQQLLQQAQANATAVFREFR